MDQISRSKKWLRRRGGVYEAVAVLWQPAHYRQHAWIELSIVRFSSISNTNAKVPEWVESFR